MSADSELISHIQILDLGLLSDGVVGIIGQQKTGRPWVPYIASRRRNIIPFVHPPLLVRFTDNSLNIVPCIYPFSSSFDATLTSLLQKKAVS